MNVGDRLASVVTVLAGRAAPGWLGRVPLLRGRENGVFPQRRADQRREFVRPPQVAVLQEQGLLLVLLLGRP